MIKMDKGSIIRTIVLAIALLNQSLVLTGKSPIPYSSEEIESGLTAALTVGASLWAWWKNNYISKKGQKQKEVLEREGLK
jgi:SPP1 family holin